MKQPTCLGDELVSPLVIDGVICAEGLTKRELFAAMAMQGLCANPAVVTMMEEATAVYAVKYADALLAELAKVTE